MIYRSDAGIQYAFVCSIQYAFVCICMQDAFVFYYFSLDIKMVNEFSKNCFNNRDALTQTKTDEINDQILAGTVHETNRVEQFFRHIERELSTK